MKDFPIKFEAIHSEYLLVCEYLQGNNVFACMQIFTREYSIHLIVKFTHSLQIFAAKQIF